MYACTYIKPKHMASVRISQSRAPPFYCALTVLLAANSMKSLCRANSTKSTISSLVGKSTNTKSPITCNSYNDTKSLS